jgi:hypothetical protein
LADIQSFQSDMLWDLCIKRVTHIQRLLQEKDGWLRMMRALHSREWVIGGIHDSPVIPANDTVLGAWINGASEPVAMWLLQLGVPCFIIHEYRKGLDFGPTIPDRRSRDCTSSFCPPQIWHLRPDVNAYEAVALRNPTLLLSEPPVPSQGPNVKALPDALARSSSHSNGYSRLVDQQYNPEPDDGDILWPSIIVFTDRIPWIRPPPIVGADNAGSWSRFAATTLDVQELYGREVMQQRGQKYKGDGTYPYYDRQNKRQLYFDGMPKVEGLVSDPSFGRLVPFYHFVGLNGTKHVRRSKWMYYDMHPKCADIGREASSPAATDLELYAQPPGHSYDDDDDDDDAGFPAIPPRNPIIMPPSPPVSETMVLPDMMEDIEPDFLSIVASHHQPISLGKLSHYLSAALSPC